MVWLQRTLQIRDTCLLCFQPVLETDAVIDFLGLWMHRECFDRDQGVAPNPNGQRRAA